MSKKNRRNVEVNEEQVIVDMPETEETEQEETEVKEKKNIFVKMGTGIGKVAGEAVRVVTSKPAKIIGGIALVGTAIAVGYEAGKNGIPSFDKDENLGDNDVETIDVSEDQTTEMPETTAEEN